MTAINLPGQLEVPLIVDHQNGIQPKGSGKLSISRNDGGVQIAKLLRSYEERPTSETWSRIQDLAKEILK